jgi:hypothetical protein
MVNQDMYYIGQEGTVMIRDPGNQKTINNVSEYNLKDTMRKISSFYLLIVCIVVILVAGCVQYPSTSQAQTTGNAATPVQTAGQSSGGSSQSYPTVAPTNAYAGQSTSAQNYNPTQTGESQRTHTVAMTISAMTSSGGGTINGVTITSPTLIATFNGGQDAAYLQSITITVNGVNVGSMNPGSGQTSLPVGTSKMFPVTSVSNIHVVGTGHFTDGSTQIIFDNTM